MRFHWFLPALRRPQQGEPSQPNGLTTRLLRRVLPAAFFSDRQTKRRGLVRRLLRAIGLTWLSSPIRRIVQAVCLTAFLWLFFFVCWPYSAQPAGIWTNWIPAEVDPATGHVIAVTETPPSQPLPLHEVVYVTDDSNAVANKPQLLGSFAIRRVADSEIELHPVERLPESKIERLLLSLGPWTLHEEKPGRWPSHYADNLAAKEFVPAELFLVIDPLVSLSTALAAKAWVWSLACAGAILLVCLIVPRGFCGYLCPLGTLIDLFDWAIGSRITRFRIRGEGWWVHLKYYLLLATLVAAAWGVLLSGFVSAIPVLTRGLLFTLAPVQNGLANGWHQLPPMNAGHLLSLVLFFAVLALGLLKPRFWCRHVCPSGALFSLANLLRLCERKVESTCIDCGKCIEICSFDAVEPDFSTRTADCTFCQTCGGVCPTDSIKFTGRWAVATLRERSHPPGGKKLRERRGFLVGAIAGTLGGLGGSAITKLFGADLDEANSPRPVRPPGSVPEREFLQLCIRCGECFKVCPSDVLQPQSFGKQGLEGLWTPLVTADWAGCAPSCNACGQVCPTGAIRAVSLAEKKAARMGLAVIDRQTCLPFAGRSDCRLCVDECVAAGYNAIEFTYVGTEVDTDGRPIEETGQLAPVVIPEDCVGCGLCQTRCFGINVAAKGLLGTSAIQVVAGDGKEDRLMSGSYIALRRRREHQRQQNLQKQRDSTNGTDSYLPGFLK